MSSSDSEYKASPSPEIAVSLSPRKRPRSSSADSTPSRKRFASAAPYNDAYRHLYNEMVRTATGDTIDGQSTWKTGQSGASIWTASEKEVFFLALDRLGKDNLLGLAAAVGSKSILEIRQYLLLLQDAAFSRAGKRDIFLKDVPAASEVSVICDRHMDTARDTLASMQEHFEAIQEQGRYGEKWLITAELADEIEVAAKDSRPSVPIKSGDDSDPLEENDSPLLQEIPEARLLIPRSFLELSRNVFMNPSPGCSYPWSHWQDLTSDSAAEPCMYRTAFRDFHALVLSITKRIMQTTLIQATSRIRSQGWRTTKGVKLYVRSRDVETALELLGMQKSKRRYWRDVPRRCRLRVTDGKWRKLQIFRWDEVEHILDSTMNMPTPLDSDADTAGADLDAEQKLFNFRAARSGTPLPSPRVSGPEEDNEVASDEAVGSDASQHTGEYLETSEIVHKEEHQSGYDSSEAEDDELERFDQETSRREERKLWSIVGQMPEDMLAFSEPEAVPKARVARAPRRETKAESDDWRTWTQYHAQWEEHRYPIPSASFIANRKSLSPARAWDPATDYETDRATDIGHAAGEDRFRRKPPRELPLRDARSYAALRGRQSQSVERTIESDTSEAEVDVPAQSIEGAGQEEANLEDVMEWN